jgi:hypothetical protein
MMAVEEESELLTTDLTARHEVVPLPDRLCTRRTPGIIDI